MRPVCSPPQALAQHRARAICSCSPILTASAAAGRAPWPASRWCARGHDDRPSHGVVLGGDAWRLARESGRAARAWRLKRFDCCRTIARGRALARAAVTSTAGNSIFVTPSVRSVAPHKSRAHRHPELRAAGRPAVSAPTCASSSRRLLDAATTSPSGTSSENRPTAIRSRCRRESVVVGGTDRAGSRAGRSQCVASRRARSRTGCSIRKSRPERSRSRRPCSTRTATTARASAAPRRSRARRPCRARARFGWPCLVNYYPAALRRVESGDDGPGVSPAVGAPGAAALDTRRRRPIRRHMQHEFARHGIQATCVGAAMEPGACLCRRPRDRRRS